MAWMGKDNPRPVPERVDVAKARQDLRHGLTLQEIAWRQGREILASDVDLALWRKLGERV